MINLFRDPFFNSVDRILESKRNLTVPHIIRKDESEYKILLSIPGLTKEDLKISTKDGLLKISFEAEENENRDYFVENFTKIFVIPDDVKEKDIVGKVENGVLTIQLPLDKKKSLERTISLN